MNNADGLQGAVFSVEDPNYGFPKSNLSLDVFGHTSAFLNIRFRSRYAIDKLAKNGF